MRHECREHSLMQGWRDERADWAWAPVPAEGPEGACPQRRGPFVRWVIQSKTVCVFIMHPSPATHPQAALVASAGAFQLVV